MSVAKFFSGLFASSSASSSADDSNHWMFRSMGMRTEAGVWVSEQLALNLPVVYGCVGLISDVLATAPAQVEQYSERTGRVEQVIDDPREPMLNLAANEYMGAFTQRQTTQAHTLLWGNGECEIIRNGFGQAVQLWPLPAGSVRPTLLGTPGRREIRYQGSVDGIRFDKPPSEVLHLKCIGLDGYEGLSPVAQARQALGLGLAMEQFGARMFQNDLRSGGWVSGVKEKGQALTNLIDHLNEQGGADNSHRIKVLGEGLTFTPGVIPPEDAQFLGSREFTIAEFARMYRIPLELLQAQGKTSSWGSGIEQLFLAFVNFTLRPWLRQWEQELTIKLLTTEERRQGMRVAFSVKDMLRGDSTARAAFYERMTGMGAMSVDEVRAEEGRNPIPGGDVFEKKAAPSPGAPADREREDDRQRKEEVA